MKKLLIPLFILLWINTAYAGSVLDYAADTSPTSDDIIYVINDPGGTPGDRKVTKADWQKILFNSGVAGSIPGTCTEPQTYWATDTNVLYICTAANTWAIYGGDVTGPAGGVADGDVVGFDGETGKIIKKITSIGAVSVDLGTSVASGHAATMDANGVLQTAFANLLPDAANGAALGSADYEWSDLYLADGGIIYFQNDQSVYITPSAGALTVTGNLLATGIVDGTAPIVITATSSNYQVGATYKSGYTFINPTSSSASNSVFLPAVGAGLQYCVGNYAGKSGTLTVNTKTGVGEQYIDLDGVLTANTGHIQATAVAGNFACFVGLSGSVWKAIPTKGTWTKD